MSTCVRGHVDPERYSNGQCKQCAVEKAEEWRRVPENWEKRRETERLRAQRQRWADKVAAMTRYGDGKCACCGESHIQLLTIDHIGENGAEHRREIFGPNYKGRAPAGARTYRWLRLNGYPDGYQVLCFNCNYGKHEYGECPHKTGGGPSDQE